jgi:predicted metal-binding membrane protein
LKQPIPGPYPALKRDTAVALAALLGIAGLAWLWIFQLALQMQSMAMPGMADMKMSHLQMMSPALAPWTPTLGLYLFAMWVIMMVGMMTPTAAPMVLVYLRVSQHAARTGHRFASAAWLLAGYLLAWTLFAAFATLAQWLLESLAMMTPTMRAAGRPIGAALLLFAGIYQFLPLKDACLSRCRAPLQFIQQHGGFQPRALPSLRLGFLHGLFCVGCCWALMALLFVVGIMNVLWIAAIMVFVLLEKLLPRTRWLTRGAGLLMIAAGLWLLAG